MIVDTEDGVSRVLTFDASGVTEQASGGVDEMAGELASRDPDLILVNRAGMPEQDDALVDALNRRSRFQNAYAWRHAPGELPA